MRKITKIVTLLLVVSWMGCEKEFISPMALTENIEVQVRARNSSALKTTGEVEVEFYSMMGGDHGPHIVIGNGPNEPGNGSDNKLKRAIVTFDAHEATYRRPASGDFAIMMVNQKGMVKREILAEVFEVTVDPTTKESWFSGLVYMDERYQGGESDHGEGGCGGEDHEGGCDGEDHEGGCDHGGSDDHGGVGGPPSRIGEIIRVYVYDGGTPGIKYDYIGWKWGSDHDPHDPLAINSGNVLDTNRFCEKPIVGGNLVVHVK